MARIFYQVGTGLLAGVLIGTFCFASVSVVGFGFGWYSSNVLAQGALYGAITGAIFGPIFFLLRTPWLRAACWEAVVVSALMLLLIGGTLLSGPVSAPGKEGELIISIIQQMLAMAVSGASAGALTGWVTNRLPKYGKKAVSSSFSKQSEPPTYKIS